MKSDDQLIALIAGADPMPPSARLDKQHRELAQRVRQRVSGADRSGSEAVRKVATVRRRRPATRGFGSAALVAMSVLVVVVVVGAFSLLVHSRHAGRPTGQKPISRVSPIPKVGQVKAAMESRPRIVQVIRGTHGEVWSRVVLDLPAKYQVVYANADDPVYALYGGLAKGRLTLVDLVEHGFEYRFTSPSGCLRRYKGSPFSGQALFGDDLPEALSARSGPALAGVVVYRGQGGERITVSRRTRLIESVTDPGLPRGGVPATRTTYSYPASISELPAPHTCP
jgi:hypothetical protein